ncbi:MAG: M23 family peptidase, partial [Bacteroidota bacterium]|nr:M23 family peptidase [Bacteroidota bacterium]
QGPHVHFEIRDTKTNKCLNPLLFGFSIADAVPPTLVRLAMYERGISVYEQTPRLFALKKTDTGYIIPKADLIVTGSNKFSFAIQAYDKLTGSGNPNGIYSASLFFDEQPLCKFVIDDMDYGETKYLNAHIDYRYRHNGGPFLQHLSKLPGDKSPVYDLINGDGEINLNDTNLHDVRIEVKDAYMNVSELSFKVQHSDSLMVPGGITASSVILYPDNVNVFEREDFEIYIDEDAIYDSVHIFYYRTNELYAGSVSGNHHIGDPSIPVHTDFTVRIKPTVAISPDLKNKVVIRRNKGGRRNVQKAEWQNDWLSAKFDEFGSFQAFVDEASPQINSLGNADTIDLSAASRIAFQPVDNFGIKSFRAELDGKWLRFTNDKYWSYIYVFDEKCPYDIHELKIIVEDLVGNITEKGWWFKRGPYTPPKKKAMKKKKSGKKGSGKKKAISGKKIKKKK